MSVLDRIKNQELTVLVGENDGYGTHLNNSLKHTNELLELAKVGERCRWTKLNDLTPTKSNYYYCLDTMHNKQFVALYSVKINMWSKASRDELWIVDYWMPLMPLPL